MALEEVSAGVVRAKYASEGRTSIGDLDRREYDGFGDPDIVNGTRGEMGPGKKAEGQSHQILRLLKFGE